MPEGFVQTPSFAQELRDLASNSLLYKDKVAEILTNHPGSEKEYLGSGKESLAIVHPDDPEKVLAFVHMKDSPANRPDTLDSSIIYHSHKIWSTLFPHNFPKIRAAISGDEARTVRNRVVSGSEERPEIKFPFADVLTTCKENGLLPPQTDMGGDNTIIGKDGGEYYVDLLSTRGPFFDLLDKEKLNAYMDKVQLPETEKKSVLSSERRLRLVYLIRDLVREQKVRKNKGEDPTLIDEDYKKEMKNFGFETEGEDFVQVRKEIDKVLEGIKKIEKPVPIPEGVEEPFELRFPDPFAASRLKRPRKNSA